MKPTRWMYALSTAVFLFATSGAPARAQGNGHGHGHDDNGDQGDHGRGHGKDKHGDRGDRGDRDNYYYRDHDRDLRGWYHDHYNNLPPGLAKRDRLPPGLERQLIVRGTLPPGLRRKIRPCPEEIVRMLPPPPAGYEHVFISGRIVLLNRRNWFIADIFNFEL